MLGRRSGGTGAAVRTPVGPLVHCAAPGMFLHILVIPFPKGTQLHARAEAGLSTPIVSLLPHCVPAPCCPRAARRRWGGSRAVGLCVFEWRGVASRSDL